MKLQLVRNATLKFVYAGQTILVDPCLGAKGSFMSFAGVAANPTVELPFSAESVLNGADLTLISHLHLDHFDSEAERLLPKVMRILCHPAHEAELRQRGFQHAEALVAPLTVGAFTIAPTPGQHGTGAILEKMGQVMGFTLTAMGEPTVYWAGDTVLTQEVFDAVDRVQPDVIITHSGGPTLFNTLLTMDDRQTIDLARRAPNSSVIAVHIEALDHCSVTRAQLRAAADDAGIPGQRLLIPFNGETVTLSRT